MIFPRFAYHECPRVRKIVGAAEGRRRVGGTVFFRGFAVARLAGRPDGTSMLEPPMAFRHPDHFPQGIFTDGPSNAENDRGHPVGDLRTAITVVFLAFSTNKGRIAQYVRVGLGL